LKAILKYINWIRRSSLYIFINRLIKNPLFIKDLIIQKRINNKNNKHITSWTIYLLIYYFPIMIAHIFTKGTTPEDIVFSSKVLKNCQYSFILSCYIQILYYWYRGICESFSLFVREKEYKTFESIINTSLSPEDILIGKFWTVFYPLSFELTVLFPFFFSMGFLTGVPYIKLFSLYFLTIFFIAFSGTIGLWASVNSKTAENAHVLTCGIIGLILFAPFIFSFILVIICKYLFCGPVYVIICLPLFLNPLFSLTQILFYGKEITFISLYYLIGSILTLVSVYSTTTLYLWKNIIKQLAVIPEE